MCICSRNSSSTTNSNGRPQNDLQKPSVTVLSHVSVLHSPDLHDLTALNFINLTVAPLASVRLHSPIQILRGLTESNSQVKFVHRHLEDIHKVK